MEELGWGEGRREGRGGRGEKGQGKEREEERRMGEKKREEGENIVREYREGSSYRGVLVDAGECTKLFACSHGLYDYHTHSLVKSITSDEEFEHELRQTGEILVVVDFSTEW